ncbi:MAG: rhodanese-like domain-containing protein [Thermodesulfobacteriota bacterium]|nr:rhodanese-like domain-containing protein [Thermodesulfobacteriota bacterium]
MRKHTLVRGSLIAVFVLLFTFSFYASCLADMSADDFVKEAKKTVKEISVADAKTAIDSGKAAVLDCRTEKEFKAGHLPKAIHLQRGLLEFKVTKKFPDKSAYIIIYCKSGGRSCLGTCTLTEMGYTNVVSMAGGWKAWVKAGHPIEE